MRQGAEVLQNLVSVFVSQIRSGFTLDSVLQVRSLFPRHSFYACQVQVPLRTILQRLVPFETQWSRSISPYGASPLLCENDCAILHLHCLSLQSCLWRLTCRKGTKKVTFGISFLCIPVKCFSGEKIRDFVCSGKLYSGKKFGFSAFGKNVFGEQNSGFLFSGIRDSGKNIRENVW